MCDYETESVSTKECSRHSSTHLERLYGHVHAAHLQHCLVHLPVLPSSQLLTHLDVRSIQLPLVHVVGDAVYGGLARVGGRVVEGRRETVRILRVVDDQFSESVEFRFGRHVALASRVKVDAIVEDSAVVAKRDGELSRLALALADQETPVDSRAEGQLGLGPGDVPVEPRVLLEAVHLGDVGGGDPPYLPPPVGRLAPVPVLALPRDFQLVSLLDGQLASLVSVVAVFGDVDVWVIIVLGGPGRQEVLEGAPAVAVGHLGDLGVILLRGVAVVLTVVI